MRSPILQPCGYQVVATVAAFEYHAFDQNVCVGHALEVVPMDCWFLTVLFSISVVRSGVCKTGLYRMLTKSQGWVWLQSDFYMCFNQWSGKPEHVEAIHKVPR